MLVNNKTEITGLDEAVSVVGTDKVLGLKNGAPTLFNINLLRSVSWCGRRWNRTQSTPVGEYIGDLDLLRALQTEIGLGGYLVDDNHERRKLNPSDHYKLASGETITLDGACGQYMAGIGTNIFLAFWSEGNYDCWGVGLKPIPGRYNYTVPVCSKAAVGHGVMDRTNLKLASAVSTAAQFRGGAGSALSAASYPNASASILSLLGYPATSISTSQFEAYGRARGAGWGAGWYWIESMMYILYAIIFGTRNSQAPINANKDANGLYQGGLGGGVSGMPDWLAFNGLYPVIPTSAGISLADSCGVYTHNILKADGTVQYAAPVPVFFGLKNPFGHLYLGKNRIIGVKQANGSYKFYVAKSSLTEWSYSDIANMQYVGQSPVGTAEWLYISKLTMEGLAGMPTELAGSSSTFFCDAAYLDAAVSCFRSPLGAGGAGNGGLDGFACFDGSLAPSDAYALLSSPLCECNGDFNPVPTLVAA